MGDMAEHFTDYKAIKSREKSQRSEANIRWLKERDLKFHLIEGSSQAVIDVSNHKFDFWTTTGSWFDRQSGKRGIGRESFLQALEGK